MTSPGGHRRTEYVVQRAIVRWLGLSGALLALALLLLSGCMWTWIRNTGQDTPASTGLLAGCAALAFAGGVASLIARGWAR